MNAIDLLQIATRPANCEEHGEFQSRNVFGTIWSHCPACENIRREKEKAEKEARDRVEKLRRWESKLGQSGIPERFKARTLESYFADTSEKKRALDFALMYSLDFNGKSGMSALFVGKPGTGKTHLAVGIGLSAMEQGYSVLFYTVMRAIRRVKDTWSRDSKETESEAIAALVEPDLLILDEVGIQFGSETEKLILFDILNERYEKRRSCILLSNLSTDEVSAFLGERIIDRLREDGGEVIPFTWESHRGKA
jgi:DNA replication protein DnaC